MTVEAAFHSLMHGDLKGDLVDLPPDHEFPMAINEVQRRINENREERKRDATEKDLQIMRESFNKRSSRPTIQEESVMGFTKPSGIKSIVEMLELETEGFGLLEDVVDPVSIDDMEHAERYAQHHRISLEKGKKGGLWSVMFHPDGKPKIGGKAIKAVLEANKSITLEDWHTRDPGRDSVASLRRYVLLLFQERDDILRDNKILRARLAPIAHLY